MRPSYSTIAIDLDEVVVETAVNVIDNYNRTYGTNMQLKDYYSHDYKNTWQAPDIETAIKRVNSYIETEEYFALPPVQTAVNTLKKLHDKYQLFIITGRPDFTEAATRRWLKKFFPDIFQDVIFSNFYHPTKKRGKGEICLEVGAELLIDDHLGHILSVAEKGVDGFLFGDFPWNEADKLPGNVRRVKDWRQVAELLL